MHSLQKHIISASSTLRILFKGSHQELLSFKLVYGELFEAKHWGAINTMEVVLVMCCFTGNSVKNVMSVTQSSTMLRQKLITSPTLEEATYRWGVNQQPSDSCPASLLFRHTQGTTESVTGPTRLTPWGPQVATSQVHDHASCRQLGWRGRVKEPLLSTAELSAGPKRQQAA